jgi:hypothetical protein
MKNWNINTFIKLTIGVLLLCYAWWLLIAPFQFSSESTDWLIIGLVLLGIYIIISTVLLKIKHRGLKIIFFLFTFGTLFINALYLSYLTPRLDVATTCNGNAYFVTSGPSFSYERLTYIQWTKWSSVLHYKTYTLSYSGWSHPDEIICDVENREAHFIKYANGYGFLLYIDGSNPQEFISTATAKLGNKLYYLAEDWILPKGCDPKKPWDCEIYINTLYECELDYLNCNALPVTYTHQSYYYLLDLITDEESEEINLVKLDYGSDNETLVFSYGKNSRCFVDGCTINIK